MAGVLAFIDDSGDTGFQIGNGSTRHLVIAACVFFEDIDIEDVAARIDGCADTNRHRREFKYSKTKDRIKDCFFNCIGPASFAVRSIVIDKTAIYSERLRENPRDLKSFAIRQLLTHHDGFVRDAKIVIDGNDQKPFGMSDHDYFTRVVNGASPGTVRKVEFVDSRTSRPIQLADMIAGAVHRHVRTDEKQSSIHFRRFVGRTARTRGGSLWRWK